MERAIVHHTARAHPPQIGCHNKHLVKPAPTSSLSSLRFAGRPFPCSGSAAASRSVGGSAALPPALAAACKLSTTELPVYAGLTRNCRSSMGHSRSPCTSQLRPLQPHWQAHLEVRQLLLLLLLHTLPLLSPLSRERVLHTRLQRSSGAPTQPCNSGENQHQAGNKGPARQFSAWPHKPEHAQMQHAILCTGAAMGRSCSSVRRERGGDRLLADKPSHLLVRPCLNDGHRRLIIGPLVPIPPLPVAAGLVPLQLAALALLNALPLRAGRKMGRQAGWPAASSNHQAASSPVLHR